MAQRTADARKKAAPARDRRGAARRIGRRLRRREEALEVGEVLDRRGAGKGIAGVEILLAKGDAVFPIESGELLEGNYRVEAISDEAVTLVYLPLDVRESLPLLAGIAAPRTARVRWDGPERVQIGAPFKVILRVTVDEPLHATPLELSFDADVLEPVSVQPGKAFDAAGFVHRINADGLIVVGSSRRGAEPVNAAADAELVVFVFKAIRVAEATELKLASLVLEGAVGKPLPLEPPGAYRAMVAP
jgi:hypothetical protein